MEYLDKTLTCIECGRSFLWTAAEQFFHAGRNFKHEPRRCKTCRERRRQQRTEVPQALADPGPARKRR